MRYDPQPVGTVTPLRSAPATQTKQASSTVVEWADPVPLPSGLLPVKEFDSDYLPQSVAPWVADIANRMQAPIDFVAVPAVVALGAVIGRKVGIRPQMRSDWTEVPNLWGCIVGRPGEMKSPAMSEAMKPLNRLENEARAEHDEAAKDFALQQEVFKLRKEDAQTRARKALKDGNKIGAMLDIGEEPEEPTARRYVIHDTTYEALGEVLAANPNGVLAFRDELVSLLRTLDREEYAAARGFFLTAWNGTSGYTFDRIIRGKTHIDAACLSMVGATQPGRLADYISRAVKGGAADDGLIQRFGLLVWPDRSSAWENVDQYPDTTYRKAAWETFTRLDTLTADAIKAEHDEFGSLPFLRLDGGAYEVFTDWRGNFENAIRSDDIPPALASHFAKYRKLVPALALINHLADGGTGAVSEVAMIRALAFSDYLDAHARRCYGATSFAETGTANLILKRIRRGDLTDGFSAKDVWRPQWSGLTDRDQVTAALDTLADHSWIAAETIPTEGRPKTLYRINPKVRA